MGCGSVCLTLGTALPAPLTAVAGARTNGETGGELSFPFCPALGCPCHLLPEATTPDFGNSPFEISTVDFHGKTIIQRTSAGAQGIVAASRADRLYAASLVTAEATVSALLSGSPDQISLVAMGDNGIKRTDEDELCAIHLRNLLEGRPGDADAVRRLILAGGEVGRFHDPARPYLHLEDIDIALDIDRYEFAVRVDFEDGRPVAPVERPAVTTPESLRRQQLNAGPTGKARAARGSAGSWRRVSRQR
jgi:hypothetical protein